MEARAGGADEVDKVTWPLERLWASRDERLRDLLHHAKEHSPWHARRLVGIDPAAVTADNLRELPVMTNADLMENWDEIVTDRRLTLAGAETELDRLRVGGSQFWLDDYLVMETGGTSGPPTVAVWDVAGWGDMAAVVLRYGLWQRQADAGADDVSPMSPFVQATIGSNRATSMSRRLATFLRHPGLENHELPASAPVPSTVDALNRLEPRGLFGYGSALTVVAKEALSGALRIEPHIVGCSSEPLTAAMRAYVEEAFGVAPSDTYAVTELGALVARSYPGRPGLCLVEDIAVYEPVVQDGHGGTRPATDGERSDSVIVTNVLNRALPLIRYQLPDRVVIGPPDPQIPFTGRTIAVAGPRPPAFTFGPVEVDAGLLVEALPTERILDYSVCQTERGVRICVWPLPGTLGPGDGPRLGRLVARVLDSGGVREAEVDIEVTDDPTDLPQTAAGKRRHYVPRDPRSDRAARARG